MSAAPAIWAYRARVERVVDGDTLDVTIDQGLHTHRSERLRLLGVNTPEVKGPTKMAGRLATIYVEDWLAEAEGPWPIVVQTARGDAFGRWLARVWRADGRCLNDDLLAAGHAVVFMAD